MLAEIGGHVPSNLWSWEGYLCWQGLEGTCLQSNEAGGLPMLGGIGGHVSSNLLSWEGYI